MMAVTIWQDLQNHQASLVNVHLHDLFKADPSRFSNFSLEAEDILLDYSKQRVTAQTLEMLCDFARSARLETHIAALFSGKIVNLSEQRAALHTALRDFSSDPLIVNQKDIKAEIQAALNRMARLVTDIREGRRLGATGKKITEIISLGIGGSDLGPVMAIQALSAFNTAGIRIHFISNVDGKTLDSVLKNLDPATTLCIINSKTFTTPETLQNAKAIRDWMSNAFGASEALSHLIGVTADPAKAEKFGVSSENILKFWDFIGGRYSVWSAVGLPIALLIGMEQFNQFLLGAHAIDKHFCTAPFHSNMPVLMALLGIWNINFWDCGTHAVIPYDDGLQQFPSYLQQLEMESNGKKALQEQGFVNHATAPVIWGGVGCNGQHAYMQLLHQGTQVIPVDFLIAATGHHDFEEHHRLLLASCFSQSKALMEGNPYEVIEPPSLQDAKRCFGNKPSNTIMYPKLTPRILGSLIALYEHKVFVQGVLWGINSFDQWGVELGKKLVKRILPHLEGGINGALDSSTEGLIRYFQKNRRQDPIQNP